MHGNLQLAQGKVTQVSCVARIDANSQILAILRLRFGTFPEMEIRNRKKKENNPKRIVTKRAAPPRCQTEDPPRLSDPEESVPAWSMDNATKLVNWPTKSIGAEESAFGLTQSLDCGFILVLTSEFFPWYEESSRLDHLDLGEVPTTVHP